MGFFKKIFDKFRKKPAQDKTVEQVAQKNEENRVFKVENNQDKFDSGLRKSSSGLNEAIANLITEYREIDEELYESLEELLISYDVGYVATMKIVDAVRDEVNYRNVSNAELIKQILIDKMFTYYIQDTDISTDINLYENRTNVVLVVGSNGVGKTTSIAKITKYFVDQNKKVLLVAGDTFRAGAVEQLKIWSARLGVDIIVPDKTGQETASVIYKGVQKGYAEHYDLVICDTSGRLQNKTNLMNELKKVYDVIHKFDETAPHETLLVLDATTGQSGLAQAKAFNEVTKLTGIILAKMDSTSKGGIVLAIKDAFNVPVKFIGLGESLDDLKPFDLEQFVDAMVAAFDDQIKVTQDHE
ncbi:signal recognition particle-docking protein FtsY [Ureaplasma ceti]|uniref:Signal recognition particle receptor FtsY n=1 Tax=Ureaplasma ceti TaxID=3119530 RepID=A0ABP9U622_9BACT